MSIAWAEAQRCSTPADTEALGEALAKELKAGDVVLLSGELGAGKTCLTRGLARGLGADDASVLSPTFALVREVTGGRLGFHHIDLYRLEGPAEMDALGLDELFNGDGICVVEWPERLGARTPPGAWALGITPLADGSREILCRRP